MKHFFNLGRNLQKLVVGGLLAAIIAVTVAPASTAMAAEAPVETTVNTAQETALPAELTSSYFQLAGSTVQPRTAYFIPDQEFSFRGTFITYGFNIPTACQARLVIAPIGNEPLYINVLNSSNISEHTITATPNEAQVHVFNISSGIHSLKFSSVTGSQFTVRMQMYTWDY